MGFELGNRKFHQYDNGKTRWDATTYATISDSIISVLTRTDEALTENKSLRIHDFYISQHDIYPHLRELKGDFSVDDVDLDKLLKDSLKRLEKSPTDRSAIAGVLTGYVFGRESAAAWGENDDSKLLGLQRLDLREEVRKAVL